MDIDAITADYIANLENGEDDPFTRATEYAQRLMIERVRDFAEYLKAVSDFESDDEPEAAQIDVQGEGMKFTNGRTANHLVVSLGGAGVVHLAADAPTRPYYVLACNGRAVDGMGAGLLQAEVTCTRCQGLRIA